MAYVGVSPLGLTLNTTPGNSPTIGSYDQGRVVDNPKAYLSLFKNSSFNVNSLGTDNEGRVITTNDNLHDDDIYDTSIISILEETGKQQSTALSAADFAYLKNLGVFPNNRLMIARRFPSPIGNDLTSIRNTTPLSTLISWVPDGNNFIDISFGEVWETNDEGDFKTVLNDIGKGVLGGDNQGDKLGEVFYSGFSSIPLPGFMETLQYKVLNLMGLTSDENADLLPGGNPNLIRNSVRRKLIGDGKAGSGLKTRFSITMTVEYELKFIDGVDPTLAYFDIITNILSFATSNSVFQFNKNFADSNNQLLQNFISGDATKLLTGLGDFATRLASAITDLAKEAIEILDKMQPKEGETKKEPATSILRDITSKFISDTIGKFIKKFRVRISSIIQAMTGTPSAPWHITIGNPKRPIFSSGDMYMSEDVKLELGPILQFNDLPSSIKCTVILINARPLGAQEIYERFNNGEGRTYKRLNLSIDDFDSNLISGTPSTSQILEDDRKYPRDQFTVGKIPQTLDEFNKARDRQGLSGLVAERNFNISADAQILVNPFLIPEEEDIPEVPLISSEYTYTAILIGNDLFRVTVNNNFRRPSLEFVYTLAQAFDTNSAIDLAKNIMDSTGIYNNGIRYPKTGTKINPN